MPPALTMHNGDSECGLNADFPDYFVRCVSDFGYRSSCLMKPNFDPLRKCDLFQAHSVLRYLPPSGGCLVSKPIQTLRHNLFPRSGAISRRFSTKTKADDRFSPG